MAQTIVDSDLHVRGALSAQSINIPTGTIEDADVNGSADISASKLIRHQSIDEQIVAPATAITAATRLLHICRAAGTLVSFEAIVTKVATGADRTVTVDLQKSSGGGAFATVLSATIGFTNASTVRVPVAATINTTTLADGDILQAVVTVAGSAGNQAEGLLVTLTATEKYV